MALTYTDDISIDGQLHFVDTSIMCLLTTIWASLSHCLPRVTAIQRVFTPSKADHGKLVPVSAENLLERTLQGFPNSCLFHKLQAGCFIKRRPQV